MAWLDIVILVIVAVSIFAGLKAGMIKTALSLAGLIVGVVLAGHFYLSLAERLSFIPREDIAKVMAFVLILLAVLVVASVLAAVLKWIASIAMLGWVNHLGGAFFGLVLGAIFCGALLATFVKFLGMSDIVSQSTLAVILLDRFPAVLALLPDDFSAIRSFFQ